LGTGSSIAVLGVLTWRLFNYWLPLPLGGAAYLLIAADRRQSGPHRVAERFGVEGRTRPATPPITTLELRLTDPEELPDPDDERGS
jgi:hypothetical protein